MVLSRFKVSGLSIYLFNLANMVCNLIFQIEIVKISYLRFLFGFSMKKTGAQQNTQKTHILIFSVGTTKEMSYQNMLYTSALQTKTVLNSASPAPSKFSIALFYGRNFRVQNRNYLFQLRKKTTTIHHGAKFQKSITPRIYV